MAGAGAGLDCECVRAARAALVLPKPARSSVGHRALQSSGRGHRAPADMRVAVAKPGRGSRDRVDDRASGQPSELRVKPAAGPQLWQDCGSEAPRLTRIAFGVEAPSRGRWTSLVVSSLWTDPVSGEGHDYTDWDDGHCMAGVERARWDLWVGPAELPAFVAEVRALLNCLRLLMNGNPQSHEQLRAELETLRARLAELTGAEGRTSQAERERDAGKTAILETALDAIIFMDSEGCVTEFNPAAERIFGFRRAEVLGQPLADFIIPPALREAHCRGLAHFLATGSGPVLNRRIEISGCRADGTEFPVELAITPFQVDGVWAFTAYIRDITERKAAEQRLAAQYTVTRILADAPTLEEATSKILQAMCESLGWDFGQLWQLDRKDGLLRFVSVWQALAADSAAFVEVSKTTTFCCGVGLLGRVWADRRPHWVADITMEANFTRAAVASHCGLRSAFAFPILYGDELLGIMEFFHHNIRKPDDPLLAMIAAAGSQFGQFIVRKRAEEGLRISEAQLAQSQKMEAIGQLASGVAHDFNNLLTIISGSSEMLLTNLRAGDPAYNPLKAIHQAGERAASLTRQLLTFSRKHVVEVKVLDLNGIVRGTENMLRRLIGEDVYLKTVLNSDLGHVKVDPGQIEQVIMNLAVNARDAMPQGGQLTIETATIDLDETYAESHAEVWSGRYILLTVSDTGTGMDEKTKARIFEPFFTTKEVGKGTGLGLAVVYGIINQSGGHIAVDSEPGHGTTFKMYLPQVERLRVTGKSQSGICEPLKGSEAILLVEDEAAVRQLIRRALEASGYTVLEASHGGEAVRVAENQPGPIHLLISDVIMPEMGGRILAERLAAARPGIKVLFVSGYTDDAVVRHGVLQAEMAFLQKPFTMAALTQKVREVLDR